jgi:branched-chain amino acid transport system ATP-binding protein
MKSGGAAILVVDRNLEPLLELADSHHIVEKGRAVWHGKSAALRGDRRVWSHYLSA